MKFTHTTIFLIALMIIFSACSAQQTAQQPIQPLPPVQDTGSAGTGSLDTSSAPLKEIHITAFNFGFEQENVELHKGDHVRVILTSRDGTHGFALPAFNVFSAPFSPGEEQVVDFIATESGTFEYFCNVPCGSGHRSMRSQLVILP